MMRSRTIASLLILFALSIPSSVLAQDLCSMVSGATLLAQDSRNTYLGTITSSTDADSILNEYGTHGSAYGVESVWNNLSQFGSSFGQYSAFNDGTVTPPVIVKGGALIGYLTTNSAISSGVTPNMLKATCN